MRERTVIREKTVVKEDSSPEDLDEIHTLMPEGDLGVTVFLYSLNDGLWRDEYGIDLSLEVAPFGKYDRALVADLSPIGAGNPISQLRFINRGENMVFLDNMLSQFTLMFAHEGDDSIQGPADLAGKTLGVPFSTSMTTVGFRAMILDEYGFDILNDTAETRASAPPVLWNLFMDGELDAMAQFSGFTIRGLANPDTVKPIFDPVELWIERTGRPAPLYNLVTTREWLDENAETALRFAEGWHGSVDLVKENVAEAIQNYGRLSGLTTEAEATTAQNLIQDGVVFGPVMDEQSVDSTWAFLELLEEYGGLENLPDKDTTFVSRPELEEMAE